MQLMILSPLEDLVQLEYPLSLLIIKLLPSMEAGIVVGMCNSAGEDAAHRGG